MFITGQTNPEVIDCLLCLIFTTWTLKLEILKYICAAKRGCFRGAVDKREKNDKPGAVVKSLAL